MGVGLFTCDGAIAKCDKACDIGKCRNIAKMPCFVIKGGFTAKLKFCGKTKDL